MDFNRNNDGNNYNQQGQRHFELPTFYPSSQVLSGWPQSTSYQLPNGGEQLVQDSSLPVYNVNSNQNFGPVVPPSTPPQPLGHRTLYGSYLPLPAQDSPLYKYDDQNQNMYAVTPGMTPIQQQQPGFILPQPILLQPGLAVPNQKADYSTPPMAQYPTPGLGVSSANIQPLDVIPDPFPLGFVNITLPVYPGNELMIAKIMEMSTQLAGPISSGQPQNNLAPSSYSWYCPVATAGNSTQLPQTECKNNQNGWKGKKREEKRNKTDLEQPLPSKSSQYCNLCMSNGQSLNFCYSHSLQDEKGNVTCPILRANICRLCGATGDIAHTIRYCPLRKWRLNNRASMDEAEKEQSEPVLLEETSS